MAIPDSPLGTRVELQIGGTLENVTADALTRDPITITRGRRDGNSRCDVSQASASFKNTDGKYSPRNPRGPWFGQFGRNTEMRVSVQGPEAYLQLTGEAADIATTPDHASLDVAGDLDVRIEATADWYAPNSSQTLIGKWSSTDGQRSWILRFFNSSLVFNWTTAGTDASAVFIQGAIPGGLRRAAFRATLDIDNGAGGKTATLYWAPTMAGPWTQISQGTAAGTTPIFASTTALEIGPSQPANVPPRLPVRGRVHRAEVRSGIGGTVVASPDFRALAEGATAFADSAGRTWTVAGAAQVSDREYRMVGEVPTWEPKWSVGGKDVWTPVEASGIQRRLGQGQKPLASTLRRRIPTATGLLAYWPMEEGRDATQAYSAVAGVQPLSVSGFDFAADDSLTGSSALPKLKNSAKLRGTIPRSTAAGWQVELVYRLPTMPAAQTEILRVTVAGSTMRTAVVYASTAGVRIETLDSTGDVIAFFTHTNPVAIADFAGVWNRLQIFTSDAGGGQTNVCATWRDVTTGGGTWTAATLITGAQGAAVGVAGDWGAATTDMAIGHLAAIALAGSGTTPGSGIYQHADDGFSGETALDRLYRLSDEESGTIDLTWVDGDPSRPSEAMGPQRPLELLDLLYQAAETDGGILYETRDRIGMAYRDRTSLYNQDPALTLDYAAGEVAPPLEPVEDDQDLRNDITRTREGGSSARVVLADGPLSVQPPPAGVGVYDDAQTRSLALDAQALQIAGWDLHLGTWDEARYRAVTVFLHKAPHLIPAVLALDIGDKLVITNPPPWLPPGPIELIVQGTTETLGLRTWTITFLCTPAGPWTVGVLEDPVLGRLDTDGSVLAASVSESGTALEVYADPFLGPRWVDSVGYPGEFPFDVTFGGERATVTAIANRADSFGRTVANSWGTSSSGHAWTETGTVASDRSVNGSRGVITLAANVSNFRFQRIITTPVGDAEIRVRVSTSAVATGESALPAVLLRYVDSSNFYRARVHFGVSGTMFCSVTRGSTQIGVSQSLPYTYTAGQEYEVRVRLTGHTIRIRVWPVGQAEPAVWHHTETVVSSPIEAGGVGLMGSAFAGLTTVNMELRFDQFEIVTPQLFTVARAVNGITKAHAAGTDLSLATPMRMAL
ncbi:hypothetical protein [Streptomyces wuyuanensis]|uniref:Uncharacterized protein n=1 Tax=Streptomyces wuyuanensis TaxID=1196353 RepID=A0A1G9W0A2_9ACTN|nr:hypothetical protein [Streptomyces wuyuanensis]SDM77601.1 hypothetical protein SAMN05444921_11361 [Streptomyces wuyuanensis]